MKRKISLPKYKLEKNGDFVIHDYNRTRPWASFFPGIAGLFGIPLWAFYVNRGQCMASMGIRSKDEAIMEFFPANRAYQLTPTHGFRTFIKVKRPGNSIFYEPFSVVESSHDPKITNKMVIRPFDLTIAESHPALGLKVEVSYFTIPGEPFAALAREVVLENTSQRSLDMEFLDGLSVLVPYGINNFFLKEMSRTIEAWMTVDNVEQGIPLFKLATDPRDTAQVSFVKGAHFYMGFREDRKGSLSKVIVDPLCVFGDPGDFRVPLEFFKTRSFVYPGRQGTKNKTPCAFLFEKIRLAPGGMRSFHSLIGHVFDVSDIKRCGIDRIDKDFISRKKQENQELINGIMDRIFTSSASKKFDLYARQTYLDNVLRGGLPYSIDTGGPQKTFYVFSRKHGDLERDYNKFSVPPTYFSQGEGNYRDINQNRRCDVFFNPLLAEKNIVDFINLLQLDGYNPLIFKGERFTVPLDVFLNSGLSKKFSQKDASKVAHLLSRPFVIGEILHYIGENKIPLASSPQDFVKELLSLVTSTQEAAFGEGYWSDHWTYNTDLLESFYALYPDRMKGLLFEKNDFVYFDTHAFVRPRHERYVIPHGEVRQGHSVFIDDDKNALIQKRQEKPHGVRTQDGDGPVLTTTLIDKLLCLIANKISTLDPCGTGIEMEADRPSWCDSLNGLPGLFGSSVSETFELKRLIELLNRFFSELNRSDSEEGTVISEVFAFVEKLTSLLKEPLTDFDFWDRSNAVKEDFRLKARRGVSGESRKMNLSVIKEFFDLSLKKLNSAVAKSYEADSGFYYTYFTHKVTRYESIRESSGKHKVLPKEFRQSRLPLSLEGFVHALRTEKAKSADIYKAVKKSPLWDKKLKMYRLNASLEKESFEVGRARVFTPGWLENGSIWLHMEYKYLLELLKNGLFREFYSDFFNTLIPFQDPRVYGRSIRENSSFIVSSAHPEKSLHGAGFVARLSGSTAEFIHMWLLMNTGPEPFFLEGREGKLALRLRPILCSRLFSKKPDFAYSFLFLGRTLVTYINRRRKDTFGADGVRPVRCSLYDPKGLMAEIEGGVIRAPYAELVREGLVDRIEVDLR